MHDLMKPQFSVLFMIHDHIDKVLSLLGSRAQACLTSYLVYPLILLSPYPVSCILGPINKNAAMSGRTLSANCYLGSAALKSFINGTNNLN